MKTIDVTPTWTGILRGMLAVVQWAGDTETGRTARYNVESEFMRMARAADAWNEYVASMKREHEEAYGDEHDQRCMFCDAEAEAGLRPEDGIRAEDFAEVE